MWAKIKAWFYKLIGRKPKEDEVFGLEVFDENGDKTVSITSELAILTHFEIISTSIAGGSSRVFDFSTFGKRVVLLGIKEVKSGDLNFEVKSSGAKLTVINRGYHLQIKFVIGVLS